MKIQHFLLLAFGICLTILLLPVFFHGNVKQNYQITHVAKDTIFRYERYGKLMHLRVGNAHGTGYPYSIHFTGEIDADAEVYFQFARGLSGKTHSFVIPKGKVDTLWRGEIYEDHMNIIYDPRETKQGNLNLAFQLN